MADDWQKDGQVDGEVYRTLQGKRDHILELA